MQNIRNFSIIAHIDHGKSTLADRFLELTSTISKDKMKPQYLEMMDLEREKGITIKMRPCRMEYKGYMLNLIDTPGHVDFSYEVSRSLAAVEGVILLVDATKGIQAQTLANLELAKRQNLVIIPVINKVDSPLAKTAETKEEMAKLMDIPNEEILEVSAKTGLNVEKLLDLVVEKIPAPKGDKEKIFKSLILDSKYELHKGVIAFIRVFEGTIKKDEKIYLIGQKAEGSSKEVGYFKPEFKITEELNIGEIGYVATGIKEPGRVRVGDTMISLKQITREGLKAENVEPLMGYHEPKPMVFASFYPENPNEYELLKDSLNKLKLNDASLTFEPEMKEFLGRGFRCGFLGSLHAEIVSERLRREFGLNLVISSPSVVYKITNQKNQEVSIYSSSDWPSQTEIKEIKEPWVKLEVMTPSQYLSPASDVVKNFGAIYVETRYFGFDKALLVYEIPLRKLIAGFYDNLKSATQGYASMNYEILEWRLADLSKLEILIAGEKEEAFSKIVKTEEAQQEGKRIVEKLKEILPAQLFSVAIQAAIGGKIIARETIGARRRDVIAPLYGGDYTRKRKLLEKQKEGKKELKNRANITIPTKVFLEMFKS